MAKTKLDIALFAQEPQFNSLDKEFLASKNVTILESPAAFAAIDATTFVYGPHFPPRLWPGGSPHLAAPFVLGVDIEKMEESPKTEEGARDVEGRRAKNKFVESRERMRWPEPESIAFSNMILYWARREEDEADEAA